MTAREKRRRYRTDPAFREAILESNRRSRQRDRNPHRARLNRLAADICRLRHSVDFHMSAAAKSDARLLELVAERERLKESTVNISR